MDIHQPLRHGLDLGTMVCPDGSDDECLAICGYF